MPAKKAMLDLSELYEKFITASRLGRRLQPNGKRISPGTIENYRFTLRLLQQFSTTKGFDLRIRLLRKLTAAELTVERKYWKKFYQQFSAWLYDECGYYDNYVGANFKNIRIFFNYLNKDLALGVGDFHKLFYVRREEIPIFPLLPEELNYLICDEDFTNRLKPRMKEVKDFFVFGCTVALRFSDLAALKRSNVRIVNGEYYLAVKSKKTNRDSLVKLPTYAKAIIEKYSRRRNSILPPFNKVNLNKYIKILLREAGFCHEVYITRNKRGIPVEQKGKAGKIAIPFCDIASTHTMRRTAITTMLTLGVPEQIVRKISGHSPAGKDFYRYVSWAQAYQDNTTENMFEKLKNMRVVKEASVMS